MMDFDPRLYRMAALGAALFLAASLAAGGLAWAQPCGPRPDVVATLHDRYGERPIHIALAKDGRVVELWANDDGAWTLLMTSPQGYACVAAAGVQGWEALPVGDPV